MPATLLFDDRRTDGASLDDAATRAAAGLAALGVGEDDRRCVALYQSIAAALRPQGLFIMSFITPPDQWRACNAEDLNFQRFLFRDALPVKWQSMRDEKAIKAQLSEAGFEVLSVIYDNQGMFPAVLARKHSRKS